MFEQEEQRIRQQLDETRESLRDFSVPPAELTKLAREEKRLAEQAELMERFRQAEQTMHESAEMLMMETDAEMRAFAEEEKRQAEEDYQRLKQAIEVSLLPSDPNDSADLVLEIRAGVGGDEAELFAAELFRMYSRYAEQHGWKVEVDSLSETPIGGLKEVVAEIHGSGTYRDLKFESGVHRVQRVPETEKTGRIHTSTATVAVLPLAEEADINLKPEEIRVDVYRSSGHGGQSVNTTDSAVRITHLPTGMIVTCQDEKSQLKNKMKAMRVLTSRLLALEHERLAKERGEQRLLQIGGGDRSEKIRTYNFPQDRITDHRINFTMHSIPRVMAGDLAPLLTALRQADIEDRMSRQRTAPPTDA